MVTHHNLNKITIRLWCTGKAYIQSIIKRKVWQRCREGPGLWVQPPEDMNFNLKTSTLSLALCFVIGPLSAYRALLWRVQGPMELDNLIDFHLVVLVL